MFVIPQSLCLSVSPDQEWNKPLIRLDSRSFSQKRGRAFFYLQFKLGGMPFHANDAADLITSLLTCCCCSVGLRFLLSSVGCLVVPHQHFVEHLSAPSGAAEQPSRGVKERQPKKRFKKLNGSELAHSSHSLRILCLAQSCPRIVRSYYCNTLSRECAHTFNCRVKERHDKLPISPFFIASSRVLCLWLA